MRRNRRTEAAGLTATSRIEAHELDSATGRVAEALGVEDGTRVMRLDRLRLGDGEPVAFDRTWLPVFFAQLLEGQFSGVARVAGTRRKREHANQGRGSHCDSSSLSTSPASSDASYSLIAFPSAGFTSASADRSLGT